MLKNKTLSGMATDIEVKTNKVKSLLLLTFVFFKLFLNMKVLWVRMNHNLWHKQLVCETFRISFSQESKHNPQIFVTEYFVKVFVLKFDETLKLKALDSQE